MNICSVGIELFHTNVRTDSHDGAFRRFGTAIKLAVCVPVCVCVYVCTSFAHLILCIDMYKRYVIGGHSNS